MGGDAIGGSIGGGLSGDSDTGGSIPGGPTGDSDTGITQDGKINLGNPKYGITSDSEVWLMQVNKSNDIASTAKFSKENNIQRSSAVNQNTFRSLTDYQCSDNIPEFVKKSRTEDVIIPVDELSSRTAASVYYSATSLSANDEKPFTENGKTYRYFWVEQEYTEGSGKVDSIKKYKAELIETGTYCTVWYISDSELGATVDSAMETIIRQNLLALDNVFDKIYPIETNLLGLPVLNNSLLYKYYGDMCNEKAVDILVYDISEDKLDGYGGRTVGYFYSGDVSPVSKDNTGIASNHSLMFHIDSYMLGKYPSMVYSTIVHEFNHLLNYVNKTYNLTKKENNIIEMKALASWFTEMLSAMAEDALYENCLNEYSSSNSVQDERVPEFLDDYLFGFKKWNFYECYGCVYGYGAYLMRNFASENGTKKGISLLHEIATNEYRDEEAVTKALQFITGNTNITYESTLPYFPVVLTNNDTGSSYSLNKNVVENIGSYNYILTAIDIFDRQWGGPKLYGFGVHNYEYDTNFRPTGIRIDKVPNDVVSGKGNVKVSSSDQNLNNLYISLGVKKDKKITVYPLNW